MVRQIILVFVSIHVYMHLAFKELMLSCVQLDLTGSSDGSVSMWEFGTTNPVSVQKSPQGAGVVTKIRFTPQGNKVRALSKV